MRMEIPCHQNQRSNNITKLKTMILDAKIILNKHLVIWMQKHIKRIIHWPSGICLSHAKIVCNLKNTINHNFNRLRKKYTWSAQEIKKKKLRNWEKSNIQSRQKSQQSWNRNKFSEPNKGHLLKPQLIFYLAVKYWRFSSQDQEVNTFFFF